MSLITLNASSRCSSRKCACRTVASLLVAALTSAPNPSNTCAICSALSSGVPLKSMCSRKCEMPACSCASSRDPPRTHRPTATERTVGSFSLTTLTPESSVVRVCSSSTLGPLYLVAARAAAVAIPAAAATPVAVAPPAGRPAAVAGAHCRELLDRLALDRGVVGEPQADAPALLVELHDTHCQLIALLDDVLDRLRALARLQVRDVDEAVRPLCELDERAEGRRLHDLACVDLPELDVLGHLADRLDGGVALLAVHGVNQHRALVVDIDLRLVLLGEGTDRLA